MSSAEKQKQDIMKTKARSEEQHYKSRSDFWTESQQANLNKKKAPDWHAHAIKDLSETSLSYNEIAKRVGRSRDTIIKVRRKYRIERPVQPKSGPRSNSDAKGQSIMHRAIGVRLTLYRDGKAFSEIADLLMISRATLKKMEMGAHDFTLNQLQAIADLLGADLASLLTPFKMKAAKE